ncbi:unnamed protein product [Polarella glacialis]|uniref:Chloride channel protein n=1 Tax=Polarella glacialis TaxID=89957 RepID=A0A813KC35_POLGL|nr:unnamed protein product [Polarella glacialis]CAE8652788.1 unnamed protein product [Polarella glacialis]CAE8696260.1 unnamed protein product [Polarella glacialis]|mmetsp:Transcript_19781/g.35283  ORF Transcript_19781/g.35283 Transcript_19781/m.35283 type:complete len:764 (-) Transcript_19781:288-2579(-)
MEELETVLAEADLPLTADGSPVFHQSRHSIPTFSRCLHAPEGTESLDYDMHESPQTLRFLSEQAAALKMKSCCLRLLGRGGIRWIVVCVAGLGTGLVASAINVSLMGLAELRRLLLSKAIESSAGVVVPYLVFLAFSLACASVAGALVCFVEPLAAGSGIPEIKSFLNGVNVPRVLRPLTLVAKGVGVIFSVAAGLPCGKEGPMIHCGAIMGALASYAFSGPLLRPISIDREQRDLVAAGAAAGVAAAFGAPVGGVLFAIEEGASHMSVDIMLKTFVCSAVSALVVHFFTGGFDGQTWGLFGAEVPLPFGHLPDLAFHIWELPTFAFMGLVGGLAGAFWNALNLRLSRWRMRYIGVRTCRRFLEVLVLTTLIVSLKFFVPVLVTGNLDYVVGTDLQTYYWDGEDEAVDVIFHRDFISPSSLLIAGTVQFVISVVTYGMGVPSGLFVPMLYLGALWGRLFGEGLLMIGMVDSHEHVAKYAVVGAVAALAGTARISISLSVIMLECIDNNSFGAPLFLATMIAKWVGSIFNPGIYDIHLELKHVPLLEPRAQKEMLSMRVQDVMAKDVVSLCPVETVRRVLEVLEDSERLHHGFPVVDEASGRFLGLIQRRMLLHLLRSGRERSIFQERLGPAEEQNTPKPVPNWLSNSELATQATGRFKMSELQSALGPQDLDRCVNLLPYTNQGAYTIPAHATVMRCYALFRSMGLRHLPVVDEQSKLCGMITRKDLILAPAHEKKWFGGQDDDAESSDQESESEDEETDAAS